jgi:GTP diphosphokinase / guanosine-3',5'-bis(diphosphate) 3'-diphosphatase
MLMRALANIDVSMDKLSIEQLASLTAQTNTESLDELFENIGLGKQPAFGVAKILQPDLDMKTVSAAPITIESADSLLISFARCCRPIPGDPIIGHMSSGKGVVVHADNCNNLQGLRAKGEQLTPINWSANVSGEFLTEVRVEVKTERGIIATLATRIAQTGTSIEGIQVHERDAENSIINLTVAVTNRIHLANVMRSVRTMRSVQKVSRGKHN